MLTTSAVVAGCASDGSGRIPAEAHTEALIGDRVPAGVSTYRDVVPQDLLTAILVREVDPEDDLSPTAIVQADRDRPFFPLEQQSRTFVDREELVEFLVATFGARELFHDAETGALEGARGSYVQRGRAYFHDERTGLRYQVTDPVMAFLGGVDGWVEVDGQLWCMDPDGSCDEGRASYLELDAIATAPTHVNNVCGGSPYTPDVCANFHTFFNTTWFPAPWARHGSNVAFLNWAPWPDTRLRARGAIQYPDYYGAPTTAPMPNAESFGEDFVETALWCLGSLECPEYVATIACGRGHVRDPDLTAGRRTGNGPGNNDTTCPPGSWSGSI